MGPEDAFDDDELRASAAAVRAEWQADEEAWTQEAFARFEHGHTIADVARACMHRGDHVTILTGDASFSGVIVGVGPDTTRLRLGAGPTDVVDVQLGVAHAVALRIGDGARTDGTRGDADVSFRARALELEDATAVVVRVGTGSL